MSNITEIDVQSNPQTTVKLIKAMEEQIKRLEEQIKRLKEVIKIQRRIIHGL